MSIAKIGALAIAGSMVAAGCAYPPTQEQSGMVIGGILGGLGGTQIGKGDGRTAAIILGTMAGAVIGGAIGRSMDETDQLRAAQTMETVRTGVSSSWENPDTGNTYVVTPTRTYETVEGPCREYTMVATIGGRPEQVYGTACRQPDGSWRMES